MKKLMKRDYIRISVFYMLVVALFSTSTACTNSASSSSSSASSLDNTTESVYKGARGTEVIICDNGIAYIDGTKGTWSRSYVNIGNRDHDYIQIDLNGYIQQGAICEGKFYYGRNAHFAVKEGYPDGEPLTQSRR